MQRIRVMTFLSNQLVILLDKTVSMYACMSKNLTIVFDLLNINIF